MSLIFFYPILPNRASLKEFVYHHYLICYISVSLYTLTTQSRRSFETFLPTFYLILTDDAKYQISMPLKFTICILMKLIRLHHQDDLNKDELNKELA